MFFGPAQWQRLTIAVRIQNVKEKVGEIWLKKSLDKVGVVWLTCLFSAVLCFGKVSLDIQPGKIVPN